MSARDNLLGTFRPTGSWMERLSVGWLYLIMLAVTLPALLLTRWWVSGICLAITVGLLLSAGLGWRGIWLSWRLALMIVAVGAYQAVIGHPMTGLVLSVNVVLAILASRMLTMTTPIPELLDALAWAVRPLRWVGLSPELFALAVTVMLRSIPYLTGVFVEVREAAEARGLGRHPLARVTPVVIRAVAYAQTTGDAIAARGLADPEP